MSRRFVCIIFFSLLGATQQLAAHEKVDELQDLFLIANAQFTLCHELTHVLISTFDLPVLGREEDAADQISTLCFLHPTDKNGRDPQAVEKLVAVADAWRLEWELDKDSGGTAYWDEHALDIQRYYHVLCVLYGSDPQRFEKLPDQLELPWQRAWSCADYEYDRVVKAGQWLLETYGVTDDLSTGRRTGKVKVVYKIPGEAKQRAHRMLKASTLFERKADLMNSMFDLPHDITIVGADCLGDQTAYWNQELREVVFCYDLVERFILLAKLRRCILGRRVGPANRRPMDPVRVRKCLIDVH
ncbi:MAG: DUF4344 domain-containing metallopeptidase [Pseudomonadales bacterium]